MKFATTIIAAAALLTIPAFANATPIVLGDSGWQAEITDNANVGILIDAEYEQFVLIEIVKVFPTPPTGGQFAPISIDFTQIAPDANTVALIALNDEIITNNTGADWLDYHWNIEGDAAFEISSTLNSGFNVSPFTNIDWTPKAGWGADYASELNLSGGIVPNGGTFTPGLDGGALVIKADFSGEDAASFTLNQNPTPEPATMILAAAGIPLLLKRRRRRRAAAC